MVELTYSKRFGTLIELFKQERFQACNREWAWPSLMVMSWETGCKAPLPSKNGNSSASRCEWGLRLPLVNYSQTASGERGDRFLLSVSVSGP